MGFLLTACGVSMLSFFIGRGMRDLFAHASYRPTLPVAGSVSTALYQARTTPRLRSASIPAPRILAAVETADRGNWIRIPALSLRLPLAVAPSLKDSDVLRTLLVGVVRYPNGVTPGERGVVVIAGHSTGEPWKGPYRFAFLRAGTLRAGDTIAVDHQDMRYTYRVTGQRRINPRITPFLDSAADRPRLALISCWPLWTTEQRIVIDAELVETARLAVRPQRAS